MLTAITKAVAEAVGVPVFVKLSGTLANLAAVAGRALEAGAAGLTLINTVGPSLAKVGRDPILSNRLGGMSGDGIRPVGLRATTLPLRSMTTIASAAYSVMFRFRSSW